MDQCAKFIRDVRRRAACELVAVSVTGAAHIFFTEVLQAYGLFVVLAMAGWLGYFGWQAWRMPRELARRGFRKRNGGKVALVCVAVFLAGAGVLALVGHQRGLLVLHPHMLWLFAAYPLWGWVQQYMVQGLVAGNLIRLTNGRANGLIITLAAAVAFGAVHVPEWELVAATFALGLVATPIYLRWRNLWPLGVLHGWLGALAYFWVLGRDPVAEML